MDDSRRSCGDYRHTWVTELGKASFVGDLDSPQQALHGLLAPALSAAINNGQVSTGAYLLDRGAVMAQELFLKATLSKSYPILELFLVRGWDINTPVDLFRPPALA